MQYCKIELALPKYFIFKCALTALCTCTSDFTYILQIEILFESYFYLITECQLIYSKAA